MKKILILLIGILFFASESCVQKSYTRTMVITLKIEDKKDIKTVGIRGDGKPLSWDNDFIMKEVIKDSIYTSTISTIIGYKFAEIKFTVNGQLELKHQPNRRVKFGNADTVFYKATFDSNK